VKYEGLDQCSAHSNELTKRFLSNLMSFKQNFLLSLNIKKQTSKRRHIEMFIFHIFIYSHSHSNHDIDFRTMYFIYCFDFDSLEFRMEVLPGEKQTLKRKGGM